MTKAMMTKLLTAPLTAAMMLSVLYGCTPANTTGAAPSTEPPVPASIQAVETPPAVEPSSASSTSSLSSGSSARDRYNRAKGQTGSGASSSTPTTKPENNQTDTVYAVEKVAELTKMNAKVETDRQECVVYVGDDSHNPYDVVWDYGEEYQLFVDAVGEAGMWDVLFDADFYKESYPMLAMLYHNDNDLLLEQFQTVGVHEGRQGSKAFNVAAYMENCDPSLVDAFGDHYECYYFYWALNQKSESKVPAVSDGHPLQMCVKLTILQQLEYKYVNQYREEAGVAAVKLDPEFLAFANYRAWVDYTGNYTAHEWLNQHTRDARNCLKLIGSDTLTENTVCGRCFAKGVTPVAYYDRYYQSSEHYEAMVSKHAAYFGCSNTYWGPDENGKFKHCQYDVYTRGLSTYMNP